MDVGLKTPLLDGFRHPEVDRESRLAAASGRVTARPQEQLALLVLLLDDPDPEVAAAADATIRAIPTDALAGVLARADTVSALREFFARRGI